MRCALHACETAMAAMRAAARPGLVARTTIWAVLHAENIRRGGEWIETRLLASGPRTNPWFQECGPRIVQPDEIVAFDTDLIGAYGFCADISRTWWIGDGAPRPDMRADYRLAREQIAANTALLQPGISFAELHDRAFVLPEPYREQRYSCMFHGVGLCDEWPYITYPEDRMPGAFEGVLEPGMVALRREPDQPRGRRLLDQARGSGARHRNRPRGAVPLPARPGAPRRLSPPRSRHAAALLAASAAAKASASWPGVQRLAHRLGLRLRRQPADRRVAVEVGREGIALGAAGDGVRRLGRR